MAQFNRNLEVSESLVSLLNRLMLLIMLIKSNICHISLTLSSTQVLHSTTVSSVALLKMFCKLTCLSLFETSKFAFWLNVWTNFYYTSHLPIFVNVNWFHFFHCKDSSRDINPVIFPNLKSALKMRNNLFIFENGLVEAKKEPEAIKDFVFLFGHC